jgi:hypothetical protein
MVEAMIESIPARRDTCGPLLPNIVVCMSLPICFDALARIAERRGGVGTADAKCRFLLAGIFAWPSA